MRIGRAIASIGLVVVLASCVVESFPDTPGNTAIKSLAALRSGVAGEMRALVCDDVVEAAQFDPSDASGFGLLSEFREAMDRNAAQGRTAFGGNAEYTISEELNLRADAAWTEIDFRGEDKTEVWRLHLVREDGKWKVCDAELRP